MQRLGGEQMCGSVHHQKTTVELLYRGHLGTWRSVLYREVSSFQGYIYTKKAYLHGTQQSVLNTEVSLFQRCPLRGVPLYIQSCAHQDCTLLRKEMS